MLELGVGADIVRLVGGLFWLLIAGALLAALLVPKTRKGKLIAVALVVGVFLAFPGRWAWNDYQEQHAFEQKQKKALARFEELCKTSGEKIHRAVVGVEGVVLMKVRGESESSYDQNLYDPFGMGEPGDAYISNFLSRLNESGKFTLVGVPHSYRYVDAIDLSDSKRYRYIGYMETPAGHSNAVFKLKREATSEPAPRYGVTYDDITFPEDRMFWIAGSSLKIIDLQTKEVIAERVGYMIDKGLGNASAGRQPWTHAFQTACPSFPKTESGYAYNSAAARFVEKVLKVKE